MSNTGEKEETKNATNALTAAAAAAGGIPQAVVAAGTTNQPKPKPPTEEFPDKPKDQIAGDTAHLKHPNDPE